MIMADTGTALDDDRLERLLPRAMARFRHRMFLGLRLPTRLGVAATAVSLGHDHAWAFVLAAVACAALDLRLAALLARRGGASTPVRLVMDLLDVVLWTLALGGIGDLTVLVAGPLILETAQRHGARALPLPVLAARPPWRRPGSPPGGSTRCPSSGPPRRGPAARSPGRTCAAAGSPRRPSCATTWKPRSAGPSCPARTAWRWAPTRSSTCWCAPLPWSPRSSATPNRCPSARGRPGSRRPAGARRPTSAWRCCGGRASTTAAAPTCRRTPTSGPAPARARCCSRPPRRATWKPAWTRCARAARSR
ncbi:hypothetical protein [Actinomadura madurae]|uniref:hypothetical protein n=1 Tax=Actinomadura madurae TaxID=1993 RepID=UPI0020D23DA0|nr:hypothetical protein [Actinomadura madurae]MCQ0008082.1 hypothetical protein [Actinomadura madurae]